MNEKDEGKDRNFDNKNEIQVMLHIK